MERGLGDCFAGVFLVPVGDGGDAGGEEDLRVFRGAGGEVDEVADGGDVRFEG